MTVVSEPFVAAALGLARLVKEYDHVGHALSDRDRQFYWEGYRNGMKHQADRVLALYASAKKQDD